MSSVSEDLWVVLYCSKDDSHVLVSDQSIIYDTRLELEDEVQFDYPGHKKLLSGIVKGASGDEKAMTKLLNRLNSETKPKRDTSFHEDRPRAAALRCRQKQKGLLGSAGKRKAESGSKKQAKGKTYPKKSTSKAVPLSILAAALNDSSDHESGSSDSDSSSTESSIKSKTPWHSKEPQAKALEKPVCVEDSCSSDSDDRPFSEEELKLIKQLSKRKQMKDFKELQNLAKRPAVKGEGASTSKRSKISGQLEVKEDVAFMEGDNICEQVDQRCNTPELELNGVSINKEKPSNREGENKALSVEAMEKPSDNEIPNGAHSVKVKEIQSSDSNGGDEGSGFENTSRKKEKKRKEKADADDVVLIHFEGDHFNYEAESSEVVKLCEGYDVFISEKEMKKAKTLTSATGLARYLTRVVCTKEARNVCSVSGKKSLVKGQIKPEQRTRLNQTGVEAIIDFVTHRAEKKAWKVPTESSLKQAMGNMLCEDRPTP